MSRIVIPTTGPDDWRALLAKPDLHWAMGKSARSLAYSWEAARGLPPEIDKALSAVFTDPVLLLATPEHKTPLPGGHRESQSDLLALIGSVEGLIVATIEGKVDEPFGPTVADWDPTGSAGRGVRFDYLCDLLGLETCPPEIHYQLLHRTGSAVIEAERFGTANAAMVVHSFSPQRRWFDAYAAFLRLFGADLDPEVPQKLTLKNGTSLTLAWVSGEPRFLIL